MHTEDFSGQLGALGASDVLQVLAQGHQSGVLVFNTRDNYQVRIALQAGVIGRVISPILPTWTRTLTSLGIDQAELRSAQLSHRSVEQTVANLVAKGLLTQTDIAAILSKRAAEALIPVLAHNQGQFHFSAHPSPPGTIPPGAKVESTLLEAFTSMGTLPELETALDYLDIELVRIGVPPEGAPPESFKVAQSLASPATLRQLVPRAGIDLGPLASAVQHGIGSGWLSPTRYSQIPYPGLPAPAFSLEQLVGSPLTLESLRGRPILLEFFRFGGCPFCNARVSELISAYPRLRQAGIEVVGIFAASTDNLRKGAGKQKPHFPLLADPGGTIHDRYGVPRSTLALADPRNMPTMMRGMRTPGSRPMGPWEGEMNRMPAAFLLRPDLTIARVFYGKNPSDRIPLHEVTEWGFELTGRRPSPGYLAQGVGSQ